MHSSSRAILRPSLFILPFPGRLVARLASSAGIGRPSVATVARRPFVADEAAWREASRAATVSPRPRAFTSAGQRRSMRTDRSMRGKSNDVEANASSSHAIVAGLEATHRSEDDRPGRCRRRSGSDEIDAHKATIGEKNREPDRVVSCGIFVL